MALFVPTKEITKSFDAVDSWICDSLVPADPALEGALKANLAASLDQIDVAPNQGKLLNLLAKITHAKRVLEIGTLGGYSAIWLAKALPSDGYLTTLEVSPHTAKVAESNIKNAGLSHIINVKVGPALETLEKMGKDPATGQFDLVFIDADKANHHNYLEWAVKLGHVGTVIVLDNVVRGGQVANLEDNSPSSVGVRKAFELMKRDKRLDSTAIQTVGFKGWDGFAVALVVE
jgi:predicted O-methyltransferase YrrM